MRTAWTAVLAGLAAIALPAWAGEFNDHCAYGLAGFDMLVETDCSVNWKDPRTGKTYCFSSRDSKDKFLKDPEANVRKAAAAFDKLNKE
ncbi:MAG TPA: hypothetical protein VFB20_08980 [Burkholderiales bacterium]|nr:hypothetical protein [Burkholderiales bacterium]